MYKVSLLSYIDVPNSEVTVTATYNNNDLTVTFMIITSDDSVTRYELFLIYGGTRVSLANYTTVLEETFEQEDIIYNVAYRVELVAFNKFGYTTVGSSDVAEITVATTTDGTGMQVTIILVTTYSN